ncbi:hypothetical protein CALCODRAFT_487659 [Calocera cornea HHB12733]|uniref:HNH nuclease domain-containing protein n=1 Tax=Calocera cornea HHB12733 TaxID=1353952 RepID=A0A165CZY5_9BASI|nr:hypothetical protein CALCODRAFT_487659 [Calocera cornea HHB12733]
MNATNINAEYRLLGVPDRPEEPDVTTFEATVRLADQEDDHAPPHPPPATPGAPAPGVALFTTPYGESKVNSETPQLRKNALARVDKKRCAITRDPGRVVQVAHIVRRSVNQNILLKFRRNGVVFDVHSRKNLMTLDPTLHCLFDRFAWAIVPTAQTLERMIGYLKHTKEPTYLGMWTSANVETPGTWYSYELATFPNMDHPIVRRDRPKEQDSSHAAFTLYLPVGDGQDEETQSNYRAPDGTPFPPFRHHAHPWVMTIAAGLRYSIHEKELTAAQRFRYDAIRQFHRLWNATVKAIVPKDGEDPEQDNKSKDGTEGGGPNPLEDVQDLYQGIQGPDPKTPTKRKPNSNTSNSKRPANDSDNTRPTKRAVMEWTRAPAPAVRDDMDIDKDDGFDPTTGDLLAALHSHGEAANWAEDLPEGSVYSADSISGAEGLYSSEADEDTPSLSGSGRGGIYDPPEVENAKDAMVQRWVNAYGGGCSMTTKHDFSTASPDGVEAGEN